MPAASHPEIGQKGLVLALKPSVKRQTGQPLLLVKGDRHPERGSGLSLERYPLGQRHNGKD